MLACCLVVAPPQHLAGTLPDVSGLPQLEALVLSGNELTGRLPELPAGMRHVNLDRNSLRSGGPRGASLGEGLGEGGPASAGQVLGVRGGSS